MKLFILFLLLAHSGDLLGQTTWSKTFGGSKEDEGRAIVATHDGGLIVGGYTDSPDNGSGYGLIGNRDNFIVRLDRGGDVLWQKRYGQCESSAQVKSIAIAQNGSIYVGGSAYIGAGDITGEGGQQAYIMMLDSNGTRKWSRSFGGFALCVASAYDGGAVIQGVNETGVVVAKYDDRGELVWRRNFSNTSGSDVTFSNSIALLSNGDVVIVADTVIGKSTDAMWDSVDVLVAMLDRDGRTKWTKVFGGSRRDTPSSVCITHDSTIVVVGTSSSRDGSFELGTMSDDNAFVLKLNREGTVLWKKMIVGSSMDWGTGAVITHDNGVVVGCLSYSNDGDFSWKEGRNRTVLLKLDKDGRVEWRTTLDSARCEMINSVGQTRDRGIVITGRDSLDPMGDVIAIKLDRYGRKASKD